MVKEMIFDRIGRRWRWWRLRRAGANIAYDVQSGGPFFSGDPKGFQCGGGAWFSSGARVIVGRTARGVGRLVIGEHLFVNHYAIIDCHFETTIGDNVMIGPH